MNYYKILKISNKATQQEIEESYEKLFVHYYSDQCDNK